MLEVESPGQRGRQKEVTKRSLRPKKLRRQYFSKCLK